MEYLSINATRTGYEPSQCGDTFTVGELIETLRYYDEDTPVYLSHDNGFSFGAITDYDIDIVSE